METNPPVRDISERQRAIKRGCILVTTTTTTLLILVLAVILYFTHFHNSASDAEVSAGAFLDNTFISNPTKEYQTTCDTYSILLNDDNQSIFSRKDRCTDEPVPHKNVQQSKSENGETPPPPPEDRKITCTLTIEDVDITKAGKKVHCHIFAEFLVTVIVSGTNNSQVLNATAKFVIPEGTFPLRGNDYGLGESLEQYMNEELDSKISGEPPHRHGKVGKCNLKCTSEPENHDNHDDDHKHDDESGSHAHHGRK